MSIRTIEMPAVYTEPGTGKFENQIIRDDAEYARALSAFTAVCTDCVLVQLKMKTLYLAKRRSKPIAHWWLIGGRKRCGEDVLASMRRSLKRETGLEIDAERLVYVGMRLIVCKDRQQEPQDTPCESLCYEFALEVTDDELALASSRLDPKEYDASCGLRAFSSVDELIAADVHPAVVDLYRDVFPS